MTISFFQHYTVVLNNVTFSGFVGVITCKAIKVISVTILMNHQYIPTNIFKLNEVSDESFSFFLYSICGQECVKKKKKNCGQE
jgi:hypothetical protein